MSVGVTRALTHVSRHLGESYTIPTRNSNLTRAFVAKIPSPPGGNPVISWRR